MIAKMMFTEGAIPFVLRAFNKEIDAAGYITDITSGQIIESEDGEQLTESNFGGIHKGKFITLDLLSIMKLVDNKGV